MRQVKLIGELEVYVLCKKIKKNELGDKMGVRYLINFGSYMLDKHDKSIFSNVWIGELWIFDKVMTKCKTL